MRIAAALKALRDDPEDKDAALKAAQSAIPEPKKAKKEAAPVEKTEEKKPAKDTTAPDAKEIVETLKPLAKA